MGCGPSKGSNKERSRGQGPRPPTSRKLASSRPRSKKQASYQLGIMQPGSNHQENRITQQHPTTQNAFQQQEPVSRIPIKYERRQGDQPRSNHQASSQLSTTQPGPRQQQNRAAVARRDEAEGDHAAPSSQTSGADYARRPPGKVDDEMWKMLAEAFTTTIDGDWHYLSSYEDNVREVLLVHGDDPKHLFWNHWSIHLEIEEWEHIRLDMTGLGKPMHKHLPCENAEPHDPKWKVLKQWVRPSLSKCMYFVSAKEARATEFIEVIRKESANPPGIGKDCADWSAGMIKVLMERGLIKVEEDWERTAEEIKKINEQQHNDAGKCGLDDGSGAQWLGQQREQGREIAGLIE